MKREIDRRTFLGTTGKVAAGLALIPGSSLAETGKTLIQENLATELTGLPGLKWWEKEPLRIVEFEEGFESGHKAELLKSLGANMEHLTRFTDTSPGTSFLDAHNLYSGEKISFGTLKNYLNEVHKRGIRVVIYFNVHAIEHNYAREHPGWQQIQDDGKPIETVYSVDSSFCINSPWREEVFQTLRKLTDYDIDGIFYDGPIFFANTCYCDACKRLFRERYSREIPSKTALSAARNDPGWSDLIEFQSDSIAAFLRDSNRILKEANPQILLYMNGNNLGPSWPTGRDNRKIIRDTDILGAEGGFLYGELSEPVYKPGAMAKLLETQAAGKPTVVFDAAKQGPWTFSTLPPGEISLLFSQTITFQANVWLAICNTPHMDSEEMAVIARFNRLITENPDPFFKTSSMAKIALLWPQEAGNFYSGSPVPLSDFTKEMKAVKAGNTSEEFYGFYDGLSRGHFPFDVLDETALDENIGRYDLVILPNATCLKKEATARIRDFVKAGGNIISTFETSLYNETGKKLDNFGLSDVFGIEKTGNVFGPLNWDYVSTADEGYFALKSLRDKSFYAPSYGLKINAGARAPVYFCDPLPGSYAGSPKISAFPFMIDNDYGKGKSIYLAGTFGGSLHRYHFPEYYQVISNLASQLAKPVVILENAPSSVEVNLRKKGKDIYIYLINFSSEMRRPIQRIIPCSGIRITVPVQERVIGSKAFFLGKDLEFVRKDDSITLTLPLINDYEVIDIRLS